MRHPLIDDPDDDFQFDIRQLLVAVFPDGAMDVDEFVRIEGSTSGRIDDLRRAFHSLVEIDTDELTMIAIEYSLCPIHFCDWASCFDDDIEECAQVRAIFPHSHDT